MFKNRKAFTLVELLVVIAIIGILVALVAAGDSSRAGRRLASSCQNNIRQLGLAVHNYTDTKKTLPSSIRPPGLTPLPRIAGFTLMLPYFEEGTKYDLYDQTTELVRQHDQQQGCQEQGNRQYADFDPAMPVGARTRASRRRSGKHALGAGSRRAIRLLADDLRRSALEPDPANPSIRRTSSMSGHRHHDAARQGIAGPGPAGVQRRPAGSRTSPTACRRRSCTPSPAAGPTLYRRGKLVGGFPDVRVNGGGWCRPASDMSIDGSSGDGDTDVGPCADQLHQRPSKSAPRSRIRTTTPSARASRIRSIRRRELLHGRRIGEVDQRQHRHPRVRPARDSQRR